MLAIRSLIDVFFAGRLGTPELAALTPAQIIILLSLSFGFGALFLVNSAVSHAIGADRESECGSYVWQGIWSSLLYGTSAALLLAILARPLFTLIDHPAEVQSAEKAYFSLACLSIPFQLAAFAVANFFFGIGRPRISLFSAGVALLIHFLLAVLLTQSPGVPHFFGGIRGLAWALIGSSLIHATFSILWMRFAPSLKRYRPQDWRFVKSRMADLWKEGLPVGLRDLVDNFVWSFVIVWLIGELGSIPLATASVFLALVDFLIIPCDGLGSAMVTKMGHELGKGSPLRADDWRRAAARIAIPYALVMGACLFILRSPIFEFLVPAPEVSLLCKELAIFLPILLFLYACYGVFDFALCATGDNRFPTLINVISSSIILGGGGLWFLHRFSEAGPAGVWTLFCANLAVIILFFLLRWNTGKWKETPFLRESSAPKDA